ARAAPKPTQALSASTAPHPRLNILRIRNSNARVTLSTRIAQNQEPRRRASLPRREATPQAAP
ncbi:MAG: hypothetical protein WA594_14355, partial [Candidatus Sulfotelmatobacter sp.]